MDAKEFLRSKGAMCDNYVISTSGKARYTIDEMMEAYAQHYHEEKLKESAQDEKPFSMSVVCQLDGSTSNVQINTIEGKYRVVYVIDPKTGKKEYISKIPLD